MSGRRGGPRQRRSPSAAAPRIVELTVEALGGRGDGIARCNGQPVFVPYTVPGDRVLARIEGRRGDGLTAAVIDVLQPGPDRIAPACRHFGSCGGCAVQHLAAPAHAAWKRELVAAALARQGLDASVVAPTVEVPPGSRRRAAFAFVRTRAGIALGFNARASHRVIDVDECPVTEPALVALLPPLRDMLIAVVPEGGSGDVLVAVAGGGLDVLVDCEARLDLFDRERLAAFAAAHDLTRLSWRCPGGGVEPVVQRRPATVVLGDVPVEVPPGAFLQPSAGGERAIVALVLAAVGERRPVADLFAGCGTLTFPLARHGAVHAVEGEGAALQALKAAAAGRGVTTEARDLARRPLLPHELKRFQAVVFDPPRGGAAEQAAALAASAVPLAVGVSCHPASFAHDARLLVEGGYRLEAVTPVDQFPWTAHVEMVGVFRR